MILPLHILRPSPLYSHTHRLSQYWICMVTCALMIEVSLCCNNSPTTAHGWGNWHSLHPTPYNPPYLSLVPQLPQHTLDTLTLRLPFTKDDSVLVPHLQQCLALKHLILWGAEDKLVMMIHSLWYPHSTLIFLYCWFQASLNSVQFSVVT